MPESDSQVVLYVDLDGTLTRSDVSFESLILLLKSNLFYLALLPWWLCRGLAFLKAEIARRVDVPVQQLPLNREFWEYLQQQKAAGRRLVLISASNQRYVSAVGEQLAIFDAAIGSDDTDNLKSAGKLARIQQMSNGEEFDYAGNSSADLAVWSRARTAILVNCNPALANKLPANTTIETFDCHRDNARNLLKAMRPHQWLKNLLIFLPLLLAHEFSELRLLLQAGIGFLSFSLCASGVYLLNDLVDLNNDRLHASKCRRPFASGKLPLSLGVAAIPVILLAALLLALLLPASFTAILIFYFLLTTLYSLLLKKMLFVDVGVLALLYTLRIFAGAAAVGVPASYWLVAFSLCLFLGLAIVKRVAELVNRDDGENGKLGGRAYRPSQLELMTTVGMVANGLAVLVFMLYINAEETLQLYASPMLLWLICPLLVYLLWRIWHFARRGRLHDDPLLFAASDHISQGVVLLSAAIVWLAI